MVKFTVEITRDADTGIFCALSADAEDDVVFGGHGDTPYEALHDLINEFEDAGLYRTGREP